MKRPSKSDVLRLRAALAGMVDLYTSLVNSGDAGRWNPEDVNEVITARSALADTV